MINFLFLQISYIFPNWLSQDINVSHIPVQESGRIKPMDTYARNQLLLFYGKEYIDAKHNPDNQRIEAIDWLVSLLMNPDEELNRKFFYISNITFKIYQVFICLVIRRYF